MGSIGDPVSVGAVTSLARPGGTITGLSSLAIELEAKRLELLKALAPQISRGVVLWNPDNPALQVSSKTASAAAQTLGLKLSFVSVTEAPTLEAVLDLVGRQRPDGLLVMAGPSRPDEPAGAAGSCRSDHRVARRGVLSPLTPWSPRSGCGSSSTSS